MTAWPELIVRARKSYRSLAGLIVVSPRLVSELTDALEEASGRREPEPQPMTPLTNEGWQMHTVTTEEVAEAFAYSGEGSDFKRVQVEQRAAFYSWLTELKAETLAAARYGECGECKQPYERFDSPTGVFLSHFEKQVDGHEAIPTTLPEEEGN